jgi:hypothetical protein
VQEQASRGKYQNKARVLFIMAVLILSFTPLATMRGAHAATAPTGIMIPLYAYPTNGTWTAVIQAKNAYPTVPFVAVINPNSGPGTSQDPNYVAGIKDLQAAGVVVLGYVPTGYATSAYSAISSLEAQVSAYDSWYHVNGIFFDEMSNIAGYESYYSTLDSYVKSLGMKYTVGNPGATVPTTYIGTLDALVIYENGGLPDLSLLGYPGHSTSNFAIVSYGVASPGQAFLTSSSSFAAWVYFTDALMPNPYNSLPTYLKDEVAMLSLVPPSVTSTTTQSLSATPPKVTVDSADLGGNPISGLWSTAQSSGNPIAGGFTPFSFPIVPGSTYIVCVADFGSYVFSSWADGSTNPCVTISPTQDTALTASYDTGASGTRTTTATSTSTTTAAPTRSIGSGGHRSD